MCHVTAETKKMDIRNYLPGGKRSREAIEDENNSESDESSSSDDSDIKEQRVQQ